LLLLYGELPEAFVNEEWGDFAKCKSATGNLRMFLVWDAAAGLRFQLPDKNGQQRVLIQVGKKNCQAWLADSGKSGTELRQTVWLRENFPRIDVGRFPVLLKLRKHAWTLYLQDLPVMRMPAPEFNPVKCQLPKSYLDKWRQRIKQRFQKTGLLYFHDDFLVEEDAENKLDNWEIMTGTWHLHTALDDAIEQESSRKLKSKPLESRRSPNFYSLKGTGKPGLIVAGYPFHDNYLLKAAVQVNQGTAGLAFYVQDEANFYTFAFSLSGKTGDPVQAVIRHHAPAVTRVLGAVSFDLGVKQWVMPEIRITGDTISAYIDGVKVLSVKEYLPPGGQLGLYVNSETEFRFDDVEARTLTHLDLTALEEIKFHTRDFTGKPFYKKSFFSWLLPAPGDRDRLFRKKNKKEQWLVFGRRNDTKPWLEAEFKPGKEKFRVGLLLDFQSRKTPGLRFICEGKGKQGREFRLESCSQGKIKVLEQRLFADLIPTEEDTFRLRADATEEGILRLYHNEELVLVEHPEKPVAGAVGIWIGPGSRGMVAGINYGFDKIPEWQDKHEKNSLFATDPFMRNWASPQGEWYTDEHNRVWHKGGFFGPFSLRIPLINNSEIHLGVPEGDHNGEYILKIAEEELILTDSSGKKEYFRKPVKEIIKKDSAGDRLFTVFVEDRWFWGVSGEKVFSKFPLPAALSGSRIRLKGFSTGDLAKTVVTRELVLDFLFGQAPYAWTINGGRWQIINRFKCDPRWSHMNGESKENLADMWSKYCFQGDFCLEMYSGTRHGWYNRVGDLNFTIMNRDATPSQGYTVTCGAWDFDHSQKYTRLYRDGKQVQESEEYLTPRWREGNKRLIRDPVLQGGRDVHGAWYNLRLRRQGRKLEFFFDNKKAFEYDDPHPINAGSLGIWTYMNSMMVARVKIAAQEIKPRPLVFKVLDPEEIEDDLPAAAGDSPPTEKPEFLLNGRLLADNGSESWQVLEEAGHPDLDFYSDGDGIRYFTVTNTLAGGRFLAKTETGIYPVEDIVGWTFLLKHTLGAEFNFHYEIGTVNAGKKFNKLKSYFQHISGTDYSRGDYQSVGEKKIPANKSKTSDWYREGEWHRVNIFASPYDYPGYGTGKLAWRLVGFGNLQPSYIFQGLTGNAPGEAYAVKGFTPVWTAVPRFEVKGSRADQSKCHVSSFNGKKKLAVKPGKFFPEEVSRNFPGGMNFAVLKIKSGKSTQKFPLAWAGMNAEPTLTCRWSPEDLNTILLDGGGNYPDPRFRGIRIRVQNQDLPVTAAGASRFKVEIPSSPEARIRDEFKKTEIKVTASYHSLKKEFDLAWENNRMLAPPVLVRLEGLAGFIHTFENREMTKRVRFDSNRMKVIKHDPVQGNYLELINQRYHQRLKMTVQIPVSFANYPLFQFRYKADYMGNFSLQPGWHSYVHVSEDLDKAKKVQWAPENIQRDGKWHTWTGQVSDSFGNESFHARIFQPGSLRFGSFHKYDQTGKNTALCLDEVVCGPAVAKAEQLAFTPHYVSVRDPVQVFWAFLPGGVSYQELKPDRQQEIRWQQVPNNQKCVPEIKISQDGIHQFFLKAKDVDGQESRIISIPVLIDRSPPRVNYVFEKSDHYAGNGTQLKINAKTGKGAPLALEKLAFTFADKPLRVGRLLNNLDHHPGKDVLLLNWPHLLRKQLQKMSDGEQQMLKISKLMDGAGNQVPDLEIPIKVDFAKDQTPPAFLPIKFPDSSKIIFDMVGQLSPKTRFRSRYLTIEAATHFNAEPYLRMKIENRNGTAKLKLAKKDRIFLREKPYLGFRIRSSAKKLKDEITLNLSLKGRQLSIPLIHPKEKKDYINLAEPIQLQPDVWTPVIIDLYSLLKAEYAEKYPGKEKFQDFPLNGIGFSISNSKKGISYDLAGMTFFGRAASYEEITLDGYDQSGLQGAKWVYTDENGKEITRWESDEMRIAYRDLKTAADQPGWLQIYLCDRAGNKTSPVHFPVFPPRLSMVEESTPPEEELEIND